MASRTTPYGSAEEVARWVVAEGVAPACAAGCARRGGAAAWRSESGGDEALFFDLASVTKPMTAVALARSGVDRRTPLGRLLPEARGTPSEEVPVELLLAHRAGLAAHRPLYAPLVHRGSVDRSAALREAANARREDAPGAPPPDGFAPVYSDLGYLLAGEALARTLGVADAGEAIAALVLAPLGIADRAGSIRGLAARGVLGPFAPTETVPWRGGEVIGAVHDENAWALDGYGASGHAGIFGTVGAVLAFGTAVADALEDEHGRAPGRGPLAGTDLSWLVHKRPGGDLRAGFDGKSAEGSSAGVRMGPRSIGHLGFTGTSLWLDTDARIVVSLLTNRVCPSRTSSGIRDARPIAHDALYARAELLAEAG